MKMWIRDRCREALVEAAAETDDALLEKFFGGEELSEEEIISGLRTGINQGQVAPMLGGAAAPNLLIAPLVDAIVKFLPSPADRPAVTVTDVKSGEEIALSCDESAPFAAQVIKTVADPFVGKLSIFRVYSGSLKGGSSFLNVSRDKTEKVGSISSMRGKKQVEMDRIIAGDIGAIAKLQNTGTGDSICDPARPVRFADMEDVYKRQDQASGGHRHRQLGGPETPADCRFHPGGQHRHFPRQRPGQ